MVVTSIIKQNNKRTRIYIDNNYCFSADYEDIKRLCIEEGKVIENNQLRDLIYECQYNKALNKALRMLTIKSRTEYELRKNLQQKDYDIMIVEQVAARLKELGYINDAEYTKMWVEDRKRVKPSGRKKLLMGLRSKGIDSALANRVVDDCNLDDFETAMEILRKKFWAEEPKLREQSEYGKIYRYLLYRGIEYNTASKAIKVFFNDNTQDDFD